MKNNNGFTLIELLAVITIMGILMLVAIPATSRVMESARDDTAINNTKSFVRQTNNEIISQSNFDKMIEDGTYKITSDGNICLEKNIDNPNDCDSLKILEVGMETGKKITGGLVRIVNDRVVSVYNIKIMDRFISVDDNNEYYVTREEIPNETKICNTTSGDISYELGTKYACKVKGNSKYNFYIIGTNGDKVSLIMDRNIAESVRWHDHGTGRNINNCGPTTAYEKLYSLTSDWENIPNIDINYTDPNNPDIKFITREEDFRLYSKNPDCEDYEVNVSNLKARLPFSSEFRGNWMYDNLDENNDYWGNETISYMGNFAAVTLRGGDEVLGQRPIGIRPVIEINKSDLG